jgi:hypothetical protein
MKKNILSLIAIIVGILMCGCSSFLEKSPTGGEAETTFFTTKDQCERAVIGAYDIHAWSGNGFPDTYLWMVGDIMSDDATKGGQTPADMSFLGDLKAFKGTASNDISLGTWRHMYWGIYRCNLIIDRVPAAPVTADLTDALKKRYVAEAKFLRGHYYFTLVTFFGGVPLVTVPLKPGEYKKARDSEEACWVQIEKDFSDAAVDLPVKSAYGAGDMGRATKGAAQAYLGKAYMYHSRPNMPQQIPGLAVAVNFTPKYALAEAELQKVVDSKEYSLFPDYTKLFTLAGENGVESVYETQHIRGPNTGWGNANEGSTTPDFQGVRDMGYAAGWGFDNPDSNFVDKEFEAGDIRKGATVYQNGDTLNKGTSCEQVAAFTNYRSSKYANKKTLKECYGYIPEMSNFPYNKRLIRYADVLLLLAEAKFQNGTGDKGLSLVNDVRKRAKLPELTAVTLEAIYHERRVELSMEGHRFFDLVRTGRAPTVLLAAGFNPAKDHGHLPIPQTEIDLSPVIQPNNY